MTFDTLHLIMAAAGFIMSLILAVIKITRDADENFRKLETKITEGISTAKSEFNALIELKAAESEGKLGRVYQRFDEYKQTIEDSFIRKDMCAVMHQANAAATDEFRKEMLRRMEGIEHKMDTIIMGKK